MLRASEAIAERNAIFRERRDMVVTLLGEVEGLSCRTPEGAFYVYPNVGSFLKKNGLGNTIALTEKLLDEARVAVVPGEAFGTHSHLRISYATSQEQIDEGLQRLRDFFTK